MKFYIILTLLLSCILCTSFTPNSTKPLDIIRFDIKNQTSHIISLLDEMIDITGSSNKTSKHKQLKLIQLLKKVRIHYKTIEWLISYVDNESEKLIIGPPLPKLDEHIPSTIILEPEGIQAIEEIICNDFRNENISTVKALTNQLKQHILDINGNIQSVLITDREILEALRNNIIRIYAIGLTSSDSPCFDQQLEEAIHSWNITGKYFLLYMPMIQNNHDLQNKITKIIGKGEAFLHRYRTIEDFDYWSFIAQYANPLYEQILYLHQQSGIELDHEVSRRNRIINYAAKTIFHSNALNPMAYSRNQYEVFSDVKKELGKILFYDVALSKNYKMSCATCHNSSIAFTDGETKSKGSLPGTHTQRNAPTLINSALSTKYFYDMSTSYLEEQIEHVVNNSIEFNTDYMEISSRLSQNQNINELMKKMYPKSSNNTISSGLISSALAMYIRSLISFESPVDSLLRGDSITKNSILNGKHLKKVKDGFNIFMGKAQCGTCHFPPTFSGLVPPLYNDNESEVLGVPSHSTSKIIDPDIGKAGVYKYSSPIYKHAFKTPGLRNISLTSPYMHNGVYKNLQQVVDFYNNGGGNGLGIQLSNQTLPSNALNLNKKEKENLIHFMNALNSPVSNY
jgi:cytochrome c peroxidase